MNTISQELNILIIDDEINVINRLKEKLQIAATELEVLLNITTRGVDEYSERHEQRISHIEELATALSPKTDLIFLDFKLGGSLIHQNNKDIWVKSKGTELIERAAKTINLSKESTKKLIGPRILFFSNSGISAWDEYKHFLGVPEANKPLAGVEQGKSRTVEELKQKIIISLSSRQL